MNFNDVAIICVFAFIGYLVVGSVINMLDERKRSGISDGKTTDANSAETKQDFAADLNTADVRTRPWYEVLNVSEAASPEEIKEAYKRQMSQYHPDKVAAMAAEIRDLAEARSKEINAAYERAIELHPAG